MSAMKDEMRRLDDLRVEYRRRAERAELREQVAVVRIAELRRALESVRARCNTPARASIACGTIWAITDNALEEDADR
jgi:hypothetical protein